VAKIDVYKGAAITVKFEGARCIHSRHCVLGNPQVFIPNAPGQWIQPEAAAAEEVVRLAHACPSGAITYERHDGGAAEAPPKVNTVRIRENGPLAFNAELHINGETRHRATLCRCGASKHKPYCDGSHTEAFFVASGEPEGQDPGPALAQRGGALEVTLKADGCLHVKGNLEICCGSGRTVQRTTEAWLCRCGGSQNKPFCDGTHKKIGFKADGSHVAESTG